MWKELAIKYAIARNDTRVWSELLNLNCEDSETAEREIAKYKLDMMSSPLMSTDMLREVMEHGFVIGDNMMSHIE